MGRPSKRSPEREQAILGALRLGNTRRNAAAYAEISDDTLARWIQADADFCGAVEKAEADAEARFVGQVAKAAADGTWQAAAWWLERRRHQDYRKREGVELTGRDGGPIESKDVTVLPDHERQALAAAIRGHLRGEEEPEGHASPALEG